jgi:phosphate transport system permease protein
MRRRVAGNGVARAVMYAFTGLALLPLALVLLFTVSNGWSTAINPDFYIHYQRPVGIPGGGVNHAIIGTLIMVGFASAIAIPVGVLAGVHLAEYGKARWAYYVRLASDVLVGTPSIAIGLVAYAVLVAPFHHFSGFSGAGALSILMLPVVTRTTEGALLLVPNGIREAGLSLGLPRWRVALQLVLRAGLPGVVTGCLLAVARAAGETAPLLFTAFGNPILNLNPTQGGMAALPLIVYKDALTPFKQLQDQAWGAALVLVVVVLVVNLTSRFVLRRQIALASQLQ